MRNGGEVLVVKESGIFLSERYSTRLSRQVWGQQFPVQVIVCEA